MKLSKTFIAPIVFLVAALVALLGAWGALGSIENASSRAVQRALTLNGYEFVDVEVNGLQVILSGEAPNEATRFRALNVAGQEVDASRVIDQIDVTPTDSVTPPRFSVEILRNDSGISMIGLIPAAVDREALAQRVQRMSLERQVTDLLESADYPVPDGWDGALDFALEALAMLPRSKISVSAQSVEVTAIADSAQQKEDWEDALADETPQGLRVSLDITAPRPVITPFTLRFTIDDAGARFDACSAPTESARNSIISAGIAAGADRAQDCTIGLGVPSADWARATSRGISALRELAGGSITFSDADVTLIAAAGTNQSNFDRVVGELEADLPEVFSLHAVLSEETSIDGSGEGASPEFVARLNAETGLQLRGRLRDESQRTIAESFARARFGADDVYSATRLDENLPAGWSVRVLAGLDALSLLSEGTLVVQPDLVDLRGETGNPDANAEISRILSDELGEAEDFRVNVTYVEELDPMAALPTPAECIADINQVLTIGTKITFDPGSADIVAGAGSTLDALAEILRNCPDVPMEIGGYTDSQGREEMNRQLSQARADSVLNALLARRVLTSNLTAVGYGEENPIADNGTEEGREANRRIEFRLLDENGDQVADEAADETTDEDASAEAPAEDAATDEAPEEATDETAATGDLPSAAAASEAEVEADGTEAGTVAGDEAASEDATTAETDAESTEETASTADETTETVATGDAAGEDTGDDTATDEAADATTDAVEAAEEEVELPVNATADMAPPRRPASILQRAAEEEAAE